MYPLKNVLDNLKNTSSINLRVLYDPKNSVRSGTLFVGNVKRLKKYIQDNNSDILNETVKEIYFTTTDVVVYI